MTVASETLRRPIRELVLYFLRLGLLGFGGPVALVGQMERELVGERGWRRRQMRGRRDMPIAAGAARDSGWRLHLVPTRRLLGRVGRRLGLHSAELRDRGEPWGSLCLSRRPEACNSDLLWRESGRYRSDFAFVLASGQARHGGLAAMGSCGRLFCRNRHSAR